MKISPLPQSPNLTVDELTQQIKDALTSIPLFFNFRVRGEIEGLKRHSSGHAYFTLLGQNSRVACVLFRSNAASVVAWPKDGDEVFVEGRLDVYGARGSYQVYATRLLPLGAGAQSRAKEELRAALEKEGLFDPRYKRPLPYYPARVAIVSSSSAAGLQDVIKVAHARYPAADLVLVPTLVQGAEAPAQIAEALARCALVAGAECVLLVRGGGSRDDLNPFDDERVVRAVRACVLPVVTGLGHQIDVTLSDAAADWHAPTPSAAAERVFPDCREIVASLVATRRVFDRTIATHLERAERNVRHVSDDLVNALVRGYLEPAAGRLEFAEKGLLTGMARCLSANERKLEATAEKLQSLSPLAILGRGYVLARDARGSLVRDASGLAPGDELSLQFRDGAIHVRVERI